MDDHISTTCQADPPTAHRAAVHSFAQELRAERVRVERERLAEEGRAARRAWAALDSLELADRYCDRRMINCRIDEASLALAALDDSGILPGLSAEHDLRQKYWRQVLSFYRALRSKLKSLLARSLRASLAVPLCLTGPELSDYRHRRR